MPINLLITYDDKGTLFVSIYCVNASFSAVSPARRATGQEPDYETFSGDIDLEEDNSATGSYTLTKVKCRNLSNTSERLASRVYRSANLPEEDASRMTRDSILAKVDQGV